MQSEDDKEREELNSNSSNDGFYVTSGHEDQSNPSSSVEFPDDSSGDDDEDLFESFDSDEEEKELYPSWEYILSVNKPVKVDAQLPAQKYLQTEVSQLMDCTENEEADDCEEDGPPDPVLGPIPPEGCQIFSSYKFILISTPTAIFPRRITWKYPIRTPFCKSHLIKQISAGNGTVVTAVEEKEQWLDPELFVIAESHVITQSYLKALAVGRRCISHDWIVECCRQNTKLKCNDFYLPAGKSIISNQVIKWHGYRQILNSWFFAIASLEPLSPEFAFWMNLLRMCGARVVTTTQIKQQGEPKGLLMIDKGYPVALIGYYRGCDLIMYTTDWLIECLIHGIVFNCNTHPNFVFVKKEEIKRLKI